MKKLILLLLFISPGLISSQDRFIETLNNYLSTKGLFLNSDISSGNSLYYEKGNDTVYINYEEKKSSECIDKRALFGDLPIKLNSENFNAMVTFPTITDKDSQTQDFLVFYKNGGCVNVSYGYSGSKFKDLIDISSFVYKALK